MFIDPTDIFLIWDPRYSRHTRQRADSGESMTFVEAVFSFVFGDGNPNENFEVRGSRWYVFMAAVGYLGEQSKAEMQ